MFSQASLSFLISLLFPPALKFFLSFPNPHCHVFIGFLTGRSLATIPGPDPVWCASWGSHSQYGGGSGAGISSLPGSPVRPQRSRVLDDSGPPGPDYLRCCPLWAPPPQCDVLLSVCSHLEVRPPGGWPPMRVPQPSSEPDQVLSLFGLSPLLPAGAWFAPFPLCVDIANFSSSPLAAMPMWLLSVAWQLRWRCHLGVV